MGSINTVYSVIGWRDVGGHVNTYTRPVTGTSEDIANFIEKFPLTSRCNVPTAKDIEKLSDQSTWYIGGGVSAVIRRRLVADMAITANQAVMATAIILQQLEEAREQYSTRSIFVRTVNLQTLVKEACNFVKCENDDTEVQGPEWFDSLMLTVGLCVSCENWLDYAKQYAFIAPRAMSFRTTVEFKIMIYVLSRACEYATDEETREVSRSMQAEYVKAIDSGRLNLAAVKALVAPISQCSEDIQPTTANAVAECMLLHAAHYMANSHFMADTIQAMTFDWIESSRTQMDSVLFEVLDILIADLDS